VLEQLKAQLFSDEKTAMIQDQVSWGKKKGEFFKIQDETFKYNLQEGIWKKDMIRITYQQKAEFILKRIKALLKRLKE
jgi:Ni,Fe-hydrogenase maturation factor